MSDEFQKTYRIICGPATGEYEEKKSRFIAYLSFAETEEEAVSFINSIKKKHYDARHNCSAFILGAKKEITRCSDDGEPSGTAGKPMLEVLLGNDLTNIVAVVTRYFGGTLLGTGGLVRAYTQAVKEALADAKTATISYCSNIKIEIAYPDVNNMLYFINNNGLQCIDTQYLDNVTFVLRVLKEDTDRIIKSVTELTLGNARSEIIDEGFYPLKDDSGDKHA